MIHKKEEKYFSIIALQVLSPLESFPKTITWYWGSLSSQLPAEGKHGSVLERWSKPANHDGRQNPATEH